MVRVCDWVYFFVGQNANNFYPEVLQRMRMSFFTGTQLCSYFSGTGWPGEVVQVVHYKPGGMGVSSHWHIYPWRGLSFSNLCKGPYEPVVALLYVSTGVWQKRLVGQGGGRVSDVWLATLSLEPPWSGLRNGFLVSRADSSDGWELLEVCGEGLESSRTRTVALGVVSRVCCGC